MKRLISLTLAGLALLISPASAADVAERKVQGFNSTGTVFVFEQFGIQDGSGFPFSDIFHISTSSADPVFTSVRARIDSETAKLGAVRRRARSAAFRFDGFLDFGTHAFHQALNETANSVSTAKFSESFATTIGNVGNNYEVTVTQQVTPDADCDIFTAGSEKRFEVTLKNLGSNATTTLSPLAFPKAFYNYLCPTDYSIADVVLFQPGNSGPTKIAVLISALVVGFEGPDRRFVAVVGELN